MLENQLILRARGKLVLRNLFTFLSLKKKSTMNIEHTMLSWNPNWENHQYFLLLQNYTYK